MDELTYPDYVRYIKIVQADATGTQWTKPVVGYTLYDGENYLGGFDSIRVADVGGHPAAVVHYTDGSGYADEQIYIVRTSS